MFCLLQLCFIVVVCFVYRVNMTQKVCFVCVYVEKKLALTRVQESSSMLQYVFTSLIIASVLLTALYFFT